MSRNVRSASSRAAHDIVRAALGDDHSCATLLRTAAGKSRGNVALAASALELGGAELPRSRILLGKSC